jgi:hypothetical protein
MYDILKVSGLIFETVNSLGMYIIYCITIVAMILLRLRLTIRLASIAEAHWQGRMFDQIHQHGHSKRTLPTIRVFGVSVSGLINIRDIFITELYELRTVYKDVFSSLNR